MRSIWYLVLSGMTSLCILQPLQAAIINGGFNTGNFSGWQVIGDASIQDAGFGTGPVEGTWQALLTTMSEEGDFFNISGTDAVAASELESFFGLSAGALDGLDQGGLAVEGSGMRQNFSANAGDVLRFQYNFLTEESTPAPDANDLAFVMLRSSTDTILQVLADTFDTNLGPSDAVLDLDTFETGFREFSFTLNTTDDYTLGIGVLDIGDDFIPSGILVDDVLLELAAPGPALFADAGGPYFLPRPGSLTLDATGSIPFDDILHFRWDLGIFGDAFGPTPTVEFTQTGRFPISLEIEDAFGAIARDDTFVRVVPEPQSLVIWSLAMLVLGVVCVLKRKRAQLVPAGNSATTA